MKVLQRYFAFTVAILLMGFSGFATAEETSWWEPLVCADLDSSKAGASPNTARIVQLDVLFTELDAVADTYDNFNYEEKLPPPLSKATLTPNCQWVELEGYFRPVRYHDYRGQLLFDVEDHYLAGGPIGMFSPHFWVVNWNDSGVSSHALHNRRLRIRARVYDQCLAILQFDRQRQELGYRFGGACHYGENTGMILTDAEFVEVLSPDKIIAQRPDLSDVLGRPIETAKLFYPPVNQQSFEPLKPVEGLPSGAFEVVRAWLHRTQSGPEEAIRIEKAENPSFDERLLERIYELYTDPDGRFSYLNARFASLDPDKVRIKFLSTKPFGEWSDTPRSWYGFGCIALSPSVSWPVAEYDAKHSISSFACTEISLWGDEWRGR